MNHFKGALCDFGKEIVIRKERFSLFYAPNNLNKQTLFVFLTKQTN